MALADSDCKAKLDSEVELEFKILRLRASVKSPRRAKLNKVAVILGPGSPGRSASL